MTQNDVNVCFFLCDACMVGGAGGWWCQHNIRRDLQGCELIDPLCNLPLPLLYIFPPASLLSLPQCVPLLCAVFSLRAKAPSRDSHKRSCPFKNRLTILRSLFFSEARREEKRGGKKCRSPVVSDPYWSQCNWFPAVWNLSLWITEQTLTE